MGVADRSTVAFVTRKRLRKQENFLRHRSQLRATFTNKNETDTDTRVSTT